MDVRVFPILCPITAGLFTSFSTQAMEKCHDSEVCLCGCVDSSIVQQRVSILSYELSYMNNGNKTFTIVVKAGMIV